MVQEWGEPSQSGHTSSAIRRWARDRRQRSTTFPTTPARHGESFLPSYAWRPMVRGASAVGRATGNACSSPLRRFIWIVIAGVWIGGLYGDVHHGAPGRCDGRRLDRGCTLLARSFVLRRNVGGLFGRLPFLPYLACSLLYAGVILKPSTPLWTGSCRVSSGSRQHRLPLLAWFGGRRQLPVQRQRSARSGDLLPRGGAL